jgi:hypothetical protein
MLSPPPLAFGTVEPPCFEVALKCPSSETASISPLRRALWRHAVLSELATPGVMVLMPIRRASAVVDFEWLLANHMAAFMLGRCGVNMVGRRLLEEFPGPVGRHVFETYSQAASCGTAQSVGCRTEPSSPIVHHRAHFAGRSVFVALTNLRAIARRRAAETAIRRLRCPEAPLPEALVERLQVPPSRFVSEPSCLMPGRARQSRL